MTSTAVTAADGFIVPIDVRALCVGTLDEQQTTATLAGATVTYHQQASQTHPAALGINVNRAFTAAPLCPLERGIHIHWAVPDALTHAALTADELTFPALPDRWLVTRLVTAGATVTARSWVVVSDALDTVEPARGTVTLPVAEVSSTAQTYRYLGRTLPLEDYDDAGHVGAGATLTGLVGQPLTAVTTGVTSFAAYYPDSRSALGFADTLADVPGAATITYVVTGWYADPAGDPAASGADLAATCLWSGADGAAPPTYTLYSGQVQSVAWNPDRRYMPQTPAAVRADAALGSTPAEALSAYFRAKTCPDVPYFETLLTAFQAGLIPSLAQPSADQLAALDETLHDLQFQSFDAGTLYAITRGSDDGAEDVEDLPQPLAEALNTLNSLQSGYLTVSEQVSSFQWAMYNDWCRYFEADADGLAAILNHATALYGQWDGLVASLNNARQAVADQVAVVEGMLTGDETLRQRPMACYWQPAEPALLVAGSEVAMATRYGGDGSYTADGTLAGRRGDLTVRAVTVNGTAIDGAAYAAVAALPAGAFPYTEAASALLVEACLLNTSLGAALTGSAESVLIDALQDLLAGEDQSVWAITAGAAPSPVAPSWWGPDGNPWLPVFLQWTVSYVPLQPTQTAGPVLQNYDPAFFTANYSVDCETSCFVAYTPGTEPGAIVLDPSEATWRPTYSGSTLLLGSSAAALAANLDAYLVDNPSATLQSIRDDLIATPTMVQAMAAFNDCLLMRQPTVQLNIAVPPNSSYQARSLTRYTTDVVGSGMPLGPDFGNDYNPIRAGYFQVSAEIVDAFGQKRPVEFASLALSESVTTLYEGGVVPDVAYAAPRLAQPARLLFQWLTPDSLTQVEMNWHPAESPLVGWLVPQHLNRGFYLYDGAGRSLGALTLDGDGIVRWSGAPGDNATIDQTIEEALAGANPLLRAFALTWSAAGAEAFTAFNQALDTVHATIAPTENLADGELSVLAGRPVGLAQVHLRLDLAGEPLANQSWACLSPDAWTETDNDFTGVRFPVALGNVDRLDDGLIGFFRSAEGGYDFSTFYTAGAPDDVAEVVRPDAETLLLTPTSAEDGAALNLMLLVDPRATVHAVTGILPTQTLQIPSDVMADALSIMELSLLAAPVLQAKAGLALPVPEVLGFDLSWVQAGTDDQGGHRWYVTPTIAAATTDAVWAYTPQSLVEGWLRLNPSVLRFAFQNDRGQPTLAPGQVQDGSIVVTNGRPGDIRFTPGQSAPDGDAAEGSILHLHFGAAVDQVDVAAMRLSASGWSFACLTDSRLGTYWSAVATAPFDLAPSQSFTIAVAGIKAAGNLLQAEISCDYSGLSGAADGVGTTLVVFGS